MAKKPVVVYGASGYTGRLVCEALRNYQLPFIAAGRDAARVRAAMQGVPGIETADYEVVEVAHDVDALAALFSGAQVVCNTVGPFLYYGETVVAACARARVHYTDTTGEIRFMDEVRKAYGEIFAAAGKVLTPSAAYMYTPLEIAAHTVLETPGIDTLDAICVATGTPTYGSTQSIFSMFQTADTAFYLAGGQRVIWPPAKGYEICAPGMPVCELAHPWGGGSLPLFLENDPRVRNCRQLACFTNRTLMEQVVALQTMYETELKSLPEREQQLKLKAIGEQIQPGMPPRENALVHRCVDHVAGRGGNRTASCTIRSFNPYQVTGAVQAAYANFLIGGLQRSAGFCSVCQAVGHREMLGQLQNFGYIADITTA
ncbi:MAG: saccharopine dehydrogenase NADP-binding domain-containing protein [Gammaproteobacteria bacterium]|nr:saccharopine dehydrogenase NADP-binding domain-containing protein [Gammaproteobacteria bacterium]